MSSFEALVPAAPAGRFDGVERPYGVADVEALRGTGDVLLLGNDDKVAQVAKLHLSSIPKRYRQPRNIVFRERAPPD